MTVNEEQMALIMEVVAEWAKYRKQQDQHQWEEDSLASYEEHQKEKDTLAFQKSLGMYYG